MLADYTYILFFCLCFSGGVKKAAKGKKAAKKGAKKAAKKK